MVDQLSQYKRSTITPVIISKKVLGKSVHYLNSHDTIKFSQSPLATKSTEQALAQMAPREKISNHFKNSKISLLRFHSIKACNLFEYTYAPFVNPISYWYLPCDFRSHQNHDSWNGLKRYNNHSVLLYHQSELCINKNNWLWFFFSCSKA